MALEAKKVRKKIMIRKEWLKSPLFRPKSALAIGKEFSWNWI